MERRDFLQTVSLAAAGLYVNGLLANPLNVRTPLGVQLYSVRDAVAKDLEATLERLANMGYANLELYGYDGSFFGHTAADFKKMLRNTGLTVISSHHNTGIASAVDGTLNKGWDKAIEDLHAIGSRYMVCAYLFPNERTPAIYKTLPKLLETSGKSVKAAGMQFAYHNHDFEFEKAGALPLYNFLLDNTTPELVAMELDLYWISKAGYDPLDYFKKYPGRFPLWHVKDMEAGTKDITEIGKGTIDFDRIFAARKQAGLQHWFVEQDVSKGDIFTSLRISRDYVMQKGY